jgi:hypothetical protein
MTGLFDTPVEKEIKGALDLLESAEEQFGVPWPYQEEREIKMLRLMHQRHPSIDLESCTEGFLVWCMGNEERRAQIKNWPQTLWTRVKNEERFRGKSFGGATRSEVPTKGHNVVGEVLSFGW